MIKSNTIKFAIYARKSTEGDDRQMASIQDQVDIANKIAERENLRVIKIYKEKGSAHKVNNRPIFNEMVQQIQTGKISGIICWQTNRLARNPQESGLIQQLLVDGKLKVIYINDKIYYPEDNVLMLGVEAGMSAQYSIDLSKNVKRGLNSKNKAGGCNSLAPQGYLNVQDEENGSRSVAIDPQRFELIQKAFRLYLTGNYSVPEIVSIMNNDWGYLSKK